MYISGLFLNQKEIQVYSVLIYILILLFPSSFLTTDYIAVI